MPRAARSPRRQLLDGIRRRWRDRGLLGALSALAGPKSELDPVDLERVRVELRECIEARGGEISARTRAADLGMLYLQLSPHGRHQFAALVAAECNVDRGAVLEAASVSLSAGDGELPAALDELRRSLEAPWLKLLKQFNTLAAGTKFLVDLRADLLGFAIDDRELVPLERDLYALLANWFDIGFLELRRITWDSPASLLEKLAELEAVHAVSSWNDLKKRLEPDRRFFAFFHPGLPDEPLIFVEVALVNGLARDITPLLDPSAPVIDPERADTAIFYSISNAQPGLVGISFGGFLIKQVVDELSAEFPRLQTFATLSPVPGFRRWLTTALTDGTAELLPSERERLTSLGEHRALLEQLAAPDLTQRPELLAALEGPLLRLCAHYLLLEKRADGRVRDPVANFHLANGARLERLNWLADPSSRGILASCGIMVNYLYRRAEIEANHERYAGEAVVPVAPAVTQLLDA